MTEPLPAFRYHPDPLATGSVIAAPDTPCLCCNRLRGYVYTGPAYTEKNFILSHAICPWCIADGSAAKMFGASFNDAGAMDDVADEIMAEIEARTPGFESWQQGAWLVCCDDAAAFLGRAGAEELRDDFPEAMDAVRTVLEEDFALAGTEIDDFIDGLDKDGEPTAYIFRCRHCARPLAAVDES
jgi:uncharacterized protein CbrC (UPF0167 family)